jgi:arabinogalactan oligomer/maltooligosaccharide transport system permease protein
MTTNFANENNETILDPQLNHPSSIKELVTELFFEGKKTFLGKTVKSILLTFIAFLIIFVVVPILAEKGVTYDSDFYRTLAVFVASGFILGLYLSLISSVEKYELTRYFILLVLGGLLAILPFLSVWQLKYFYRTRIVETDSGFAEISEYADYTGDLTSDGSDITEPLIVMPWHASYLDGVSGFQTFIIIGALLISNAGLIIFILSGFMFYKSLKRDVKYRNELGQLISSQYDINYNFGVKSGSISINRLLRMAAGLIFLGVIFVFLGLNGLHGLRNVMIKPGIYIAMGAAFHAVYLGADPQLRERMANSKLAYGFLSPTIFMLLFELYIPILLALFLSFQNIRNKAVQYYDEDNPRLLETENVGFDNYEFIVNDSLIFITIAFVVFSLITIKISQYANNYDSGKIRITTKVASLFLWFTSMYWIVVQALVKDYEEFIETNPGSNLFVDPSPVPIFTNTIVWTIFSVVSHVVIGVTLAMLMNTEFKGRPIIRSIMIIPWAVPNFITISIFAAFILDDEAGAVNIFLKYFHLEPRTFMSNENILNSSILVNIWLGYPFMMVAILAALQSIPKEMYEAADVEGATRWQKFRYITFPTIKPTLYVVSLLGFIWTFNLFNVIYLMTLGRTTILTPENYYILIVYIFFVFRGQNWAIAATMSFLLFLLVAGFSFVFTKAMGRGPYETSGVD